MLQSQLDGRDDKMLLVDDDAYKKVQKEFNSQTSKINKLNLLDCGTEETQLQVQ